MDNVRPISVPADTLNDCTLERWSVLPPEQHQIVATSLSNALSTSGYSFTNWRIETYGQEGEQAVLIFTDARTHLDFALIPGSTLLPGYDEDQLKRYIEIYTVVKRYERDEEDEDEELISDAESESEAQAVIFNSLEQPTVFASNAPCDLRRKPPISIAPFLMAVTPVLAETPEIRKVVTLPKWWRETWEEMATSNLPIRLRWDMLAPVLTHYRWEVPTTQEWEWASQGGKSSIFYWGDQVPRFVVNPIAYYADEDEIDEYTQYAAEKDAEIDTKWSLAERALVTDAVDYDDVMRMDFPPSVYTPRRWPYANRFGLVGLLAWGEWCARIDDPNDPYPLITRGGAANGFPWQACGEWMLLLRAAEGRLNIDTDYGEWNTLRPILRFQQE